MAKCRSCGKKFHACSGCGLTHNYEYDYCNDFCWRDSEEYNDLKKCFNSFYNGLNNKQKNSFLTILECFDSDYEYEIENWINKLD